MVEIALEKSPIEQSALVAADEALAKKYAKETMTQDMQRLLNIQVQALKDITLSRSPTPSVESTKKSEVTPAQAQTKTPHESQEVKTGRYGGRVLRERIKHGGDNSINTAGKAVRTHDHDHHVQRDHEKAKRARLKGKHTARLAAEEGRSDFRRTTFVEAVMGEGYRQRGEFGSWTQAVSRQPGLSPSLS